ncbi:hypothetical protein [Propionicicella superfundia]|uniref:hypothetical protein n=1 Tax=Propionicicella superfundia TaxID=348582 RepID=UPI0004288212|nr:hypothetical protein [Propionicicella superfundia]
MTTWHARVTFARTGVITPEILADALERLDRLSPAGSVDPDGGQGSVGVFVEATDPVAAAAAAAELVSEAVDGDVTVTGLEVATEAAFLTALSRPRFPEVVGYAEIADMAGVSRQRARAFAGMPGFPPAVIETRQGPLMDRAAVAAWVARRNTSTGRPRRAG